MDGLASAVPFRDTGKDVSALTDSALEGELLAVAGYCNCMQARMIRLIQEVQRRELWLRSGLPNAAMWLSWKIHLAAGSAREHVRVAKALQRLPTTTAQFAKGRLSYSQVRAMTRVATAATEAFLLRMAEQCTAAQLERLVRQYRSVDEDEQRRLAAGAFDARTFWWVHVSAETLAGDDGATETAGQPKRGAWLEHGGDVPAETARRHACAGALVPIWENAALQPLAIGRRTRIIPPALTRALRARDETCTFPGCQHRLHLHAHHIRHWAQGGTTDLDNLTLLCGQHHRQVHEGGWQLQRTKGSISVSPAPPGTA